MIARYLLAAVMLWGGCGHDSDLAPIVPQTPTRTDTAPMNTPTRTFRPGLPQPTATPTYETIDSTITDPNGYYELHSTTLDGVSVIPSKVGGTCNAVTEGDAREILAAVVGRRALSPQQLLACDVSGDGTCSVRDAALILARARGQGARFPAADACASDWLYWPAPDAVPGVETRSILPRLDATGCTMGAIEVVSGPYPPMVAGQSFLGILLGDVDGDWQPCGGGA